MKLLPIMIREKNWDERDMKGSNIYLSTYFCVLLNVESKSILHVEKVKLTKKNGKGDAKNWEQNETNECYDHT